VASRKLNLLTQHAIICGLLYGILVYLVMNLIVLPLSAIYFKPVYSPAAVVTGLIIHMLCVGLPIALVVSRYSK
jgi:ABC-type antimicrobial peptide transport system permease subunit